MLRCLKVYLQSAEGDVSRVFWLCSPEVMLIIMKLFNTPIITSYSQGSDFSRDPFHLCEGTKNPIYLK